MLSRGIRRFHFGTKGAKLSRKKPAASNELVQYAQNLRSQLAPAQPSLVTAEPLKTLVDLAKAATESPKIPESVYRLIARTLDAYPNYKGSISAENLQLVFLAVAKNTSNLELATKLYMDLYRHTKLSPERKLETGIEYYRLLRENGLHLEADKMISAVLKDNSSIVTDQSIIALLNILETQTIKHRNHEHYHIYSRESTERVVRGIMAIVSSSKTAPSEPVLAHCIKMLLDCRSINGLDQLADFIYFMNPHFKVPKEAAVIFLDAYLQFPNAHNAAGRKLLNLNLAAADEQTPLDVCELLLMACIHFQEPVQLGKRVHELIAVKNYDPNNDYTKETWDVLAQWAVYTGKTLEALETNVLAQIPADLCDEKTLYAMLVAASDKAQCDERTINSIIELFKHNYGIEPDAAVYELLIRRALNAVEIEHARKLFIESNADWNADSNKHTGVLSELLVALCRTPGIPRQTVIDTYQRVQLFVPHVAYPAQVALLEMFLDISENNDYSAAGIFLLSQFGEQPNLPFESNREIFDLFISRIMAARTEDEAWALFGLLNCTVYLPYQAYYPLQEKLCSLGRPDAAHLLFRQLRSRSKQDGTRPPGEEIYMMLFAQYARWRYEEGVMELETYFRVDLNNDMTVSMMNRILGAYVALGDGHKVSNLWTEALSLPRGGIHGPNNETMCLMIQFYGTHLGIDAVEDLWTKMPRTFKVLPSKESLKQYVIANCYHGYYMRALELVKMAPKAYNIEISGDILQALYNWTMLPARKNEVREFAQQHYADEWALLESRPGALKEILLPLENIGNEGDEADARFEAIKKLQEDEKMDLIVK